MMQSHENACFEHQEDISEDDLETNLRLDGEDMPTATSWLRRMKTPVNKKGKPTKERAGSSARISTAKRKRSDSVFVSSPDTAACVICYGGMTEVLQCRKCYLKVCFDCRAIQDMEGRGHSRDWTCESCAHGGVGLEILLSAPSQRKSIVTKTGEAPKKGRGKPKILQKEERLNVPIRFRFLRFVFLSLFTIVANSFVRALSDLDGLNITGTCVEDSPKVILMDITIDALLVQCTTNWREGKDSGLNVLPNTMTADESCDSTPLRYSL